MSTDTSTQDMWDMKREMVIPITIDVELQGLRVLDTLLWDSEQQQLSPEAFARQMSEELGLSPNFVQPIARSISRQLVDSKRMLRKWATRTAASATEDIRQIDIDVRFRSVVYRDRLQWNVNCLSNSPELFARCTVADLCLPQEMEPVIAFTIHQQLLDHRVKAGRSGDSTDELQPEAVTGPHLCHVQPVDQYEFNSRDWRIHSAGLGDCAPVYCCPVAAYQCTADQCRSNPPGVCICGFAAPHGRHVLSQGNDQLRGTSSRSVRRLPRLLRQQFLCCSSLWCSVIPGVGPHRLQAYL